MGKYDSIAPITEMPEYCEACLTKVTTMTFKGSGVCSTICLNHRDGDQKIGGELVQHVKHNRPGI